MKQLNYKELHDDSRVWVYQADRALTDREVEEIKAKGDIFVFQWAAHGKKLKAAVEISYNRFLVLFADETQEQASGCSIDSSVHFIQKLEKDYNLSFTNRLIITYKKDNEIQQISLANFESMLESGEADENTIVFNNLVQTKKEFDQKWEVPVKDSWHNKLLSKRAV